MAKITGNTGKVDLKTEDVTTELDPQSNTDAFAGREVQELTDPTAIEAKEFVEQFEPASSEDVAYVKQTPEIPKFKFEYNNKTAESYAKYGFKVPDQFGKDSQETQFLSKVGPNEWDKIIRTVTKIVRVFAIDYDDPKLARREFIYWYENWQAKNYLGEWIAPVTDHVEGVYNEQDRKPLPPKDGRPTGYKRTGSHAVHYVKFNKLNVDKVIAESMGSDADNIMFVVKNGPVRNDKFTYDQFLNLSLMESMNLIRLPGGPEMKPYVPQS